jgi:hypothetical protein
MMFAGLVLAGSCAAEEVSFEKDLMPLFERSCAICHKRDGNEKAIKNGVFYEKKEDVLSLVGTHIVPGKPEESNLLKVLDQTKKFGRRKMPMPPPKAAAPKWSAEELKRFSDWIKAGAKDS